MLSDFDELMAGPGSKLPQGPREGLAALKPREMNADTFGAQVLEVLLKQDVALLCSVQSLRMARVAPRAAAERPGKTDGGPIRLRLSFIQI